jgi:hypothetical protein
MSDREWISAAEATEIIGVGRSTVYRSLRDPVERASVWGEEGVGWRIKPLSRRGIFQVDRKQAEHVARQRRSSSDLE